MGRLAGVGTEEGVGEEVNRVTSDQSFYAVGSGDRAVDDRPYETQYRLVILDWEIDIGAGEFSFFLFFLCSLNRFFLHLLCVPLKQELHTVA